MIRIHKAITYLALLACPLIAFLTLAGPEGFAATPYPRFMTFVHMNVGPCYAGHCPVYEMEISAINGRNGTLTFNGVRDTCVRGEMSKMFTLEKLNALKTEIEQSGFFNLRGIGYVINHRPGYFIDVSFNGKRIRTSSVLDDSRTPVEFSRIAIMLTAIANEDGWVSGCPEQERTKP